MTVALLLLSRFPLLGTGLLLVAAAAAVFDGVLFVRLGARIADEP